MKTYLKIQSHNQIISGTLSSWYNSKEIIVLCHGLNSNREESESFTQLIKTFDKRKLNSFAFDFYAHGDSSGNDLDFNIDKALQNLHDVLDYLRKDYSRFILLGASFGGTIVSLYGSLHDYNVKKIILWYPALNFNDITLFNQKVVNLVHDQGYYTLKSTRSNRQMRLGNSFFYQLKNYYPLNSLYQYEIPIKIIHGNHDKIVPYTSSLKAVNKKNIEVCIIKQGEHGFPIQNPKQLASAIQETLDFINS